MIKAINELQDSKIILDQIKKHIDGETKLYINYPYCENRCSYCVYYIDKFSSKKSNIFLKYLNKEIYYYKQVLKEYKFKDLYIGGGSPNLVDPKKILENVGQIVNFDNLYRFVVEVFPRDNMHDYIKKLKKYNIKKIQIGAQSLNENSLKKENRHVSKKTILKSMQAMSESGLIWAVDLMNGFASEKKNDYKSDLKEVLSMRPTGIHLYDMRMQKENDFYHRKGDCKYGKYKRVNLMHELGGMLKSEGYVKIGDEWCLESNQKNIEYALKNKNTRGESNVVGIGLGARSRIGRIKYMNTKNLDEYKNSLDGGVLPIKKIFNYGNNLYSVANVLMELNGPLKFNFENIFQDNVTTKEDKKEVYRLISYLKKNGISFVVNKDDFKINLNNWAKCIFFIEKYLEEKSGAKYFYKN